MRCILLTVALTIQLCNAGEVRSESETSLKRLQQAPIPPAPYGANLYSPLPGCWDSTTLSSDLPTPDCLVAKTAFALPDFCAKWPKTRNCVLYLAPAFCFDIEDQSKIQECLASVPLGPCKANPSGRACSSGLFTAMAKIADPTPPNRRGSNSSLQIWPGIFVPTNGGPDVFYGGFLDPTWDPLLLHRRDLANPIWIAGQFVEGMFKNLWNGGVQIAELASLPFRETMAFDCWIARKAAHTISESEGEGMDALCVTFLDTLAKSAAYVEVFELSIDNKYQQYGDYTALAIQVLLGGVQAVRALPGITRSALALFEVAKNELGAFLVAKNKSGAAVSIFRKLINGKKAGLTARQAETLLDDLKKKGLKDLVPCGGKKKLRSRIDKVLDLCIPDIPQTSETEALLDLFPEIHGAEEALITDFSVVAVPQPATNAAAVARAAGPAAEEAVLSSAAEAVEETSDFLIRDPNQGPSDTIWAKRPGDPAVADSGDASRGPKRARTQDEPVTVQDYHLRKADFKIDFGSQQTYFPGGEDRMALFNSDYQAEMALFDGGPDSTGYWRALQNSGKARAEIRQEFLTKFPSDRPVLEAYFQGLSEDVDELISKGVERNLMEFHTLPKFQGTGWRRPPHASPNVRKTLAKLRNLFESGHQPSSSDYFKLNDFGAKDPKGVSLIPEFGGTADVGIHIKDNIFVIRTSTARIIGPLLPNRAADTLWISNFETNFVYRCIGRARLIPLSDPVDLKESWAYFFEEVSAIASV